MSSIFIRAFEPDDYLLINKWRNDPEIHKLIGGTFRYVSSEMEKKWVQEKMLNNYNDIYFSICLNNESKIMVGHTSLNDIDYINRSIEGSGIVIGDKEANDGLVLFETILLLLDYAFNTLNMNRFAAKVLADHIISNSFFKAINCKCEGIFRQSIYKNGKYNDQYLYSLLCDEYYQYIDSGELKIMKIIKRFVALNKQSLASVHTNIQNEH